MISLITPIVVLILMAKAGIPWWGMAIYGAVFISDLIVSAYKAGRKEE